MNEAAVIESVKRYKLVSDAEIMSAELEVKRSKGTKTMLGALMANGLLSEDQVRRLDQRHGKVRPACFRCLKLATFDKANFTGEFACPYCKEVVSFKRGTAGPVEELLPNPPDRAVDKIVERFLPKTSLTPEQIAQLKKVHRTTTPRPTLVELIERDGLLPRGVAFGLKGKAIAIIRNKVPQWEDLRQDYELGRFLCRVMLVSHRVLSDALQHQFEATIKGKSVALRAELGAKGELTDYQLRRYLPECFDDRTQRQAIIALLDEEAQIPEGVALAPAEVDWDDSMNELILEQRELRVNLLDD